MKALWFFETFTTIPENFNLRDKNFIEKTDTKGFNNTVTEVLCPKAIPWKDITGHFPTSIFSEKANKPHEICFCNVRC
jgi:hypothetical protein